MMHSIKKIRFTAVAIALSCAFGIAATASPQEKSVAEKPTAKRISDSGRDPFRKFEAPRPAAKRTQNLVAIPSIQERIAQYRSQKAAAMSARIAAPKPTTALLLSEMQVVGISRSPRGYAAIVEATPINLSYVLYPGERFYDGQLVAIEDNRLIFRRETVFTDGRRERSVEIKSLRQPGSPTDMTTTLSSAAAPAATESEKKADTSAQANKPN
ncbi:MAG: hypothetical protein M3447_08340 [Acidobacteriota bacterium]|nr:hypothetical protein [Acidobacteriota bacterium]